MRRLHQSKNELLEQLATLNLMDQQDEEFEEYSLGLIKEWHNEGKDIRPLVRELNQEFVKRKLKDEKGENTFERLGFALC
jgi:hypothetical protein